MLKTKDIIELIKDREDVNVAITDPAVHTVHVDLLKAKHVTIIVNNADKEFIQQHLNRR